MFLIDFREKVREREKERGEERDRQKERKLLMWHKESLMWETNINRLSTLHIQTRDQTCNVDMFPILDQTHNLTVYRNMLQPMSNLTRAQLAIF